MTKGPCTIAGCEKTIHSAGLCAMHRRRKQVHGDPLFVKFDRYSDPDKAFAARTRLEGDCLVWTGAKYPSGYGQIRINDVIVRTHRYAWERANGPIPDGVMLDHTCFNRACCNVGHLRLATSGQNNSNRQGANRNSKSGIRGVRYHRQSGLWQSIVIVNRVEHCKYSKTIEEAERVVIAMRRELMPFSQEPPEDKP